MLVFANRASNVLYDFLVSNHTDKLYLLPATVCPCIPDTFIKANCKFEFIDIDVNHAMDKSICFDRLSKSDCGGILFVHAYGHKFDNEDFYSQLKKRYPELIIIDDRCLLSPSFIERDDNADLTIYSTGYAKYVEFGYGGWGLLGKQRDYHQALPQSQYLQEDPQDYQRKVLSEIIISREHKEFINSIYNKELSMISKVHIWENYLDWRYMITVPIELRDGVLKSIFAHGYFAGTNYPSQAWNYNQQKCPLAEQEARGVINLFNDFRADESFAIGVCNAIKEVIK